MVSLRAHNCMTQGFGDKNEAHLSTIQSSPRAYARVPRAHEDPWWASCYRRTSRQGARAPFGLEVT